MSGKIEIIVKDVNRPSAKAIQNFTQRLYELLAVVEQREEKGEDNTAEDIKIYV